MRCWIGCLALLTVLQACGYRPLDGGGGPKGVQRLHVAGIANDTFNPGIQAAVGAAIIRQLRFNTRIHVVDETSADLVLTGRVTSYQNDAIAFNVQDIGRRYRVRITLQASLVGRSGGAVRLTQDVGGEAYYTTGASAADTRAAEQEAMQRAAQDLARQLVSLLVEEL
jgi:hypothetical protein